MEAESTQSTETYIKVMGWLHENKKKLMIGGAVAVLVALVIAVIALQKSAAEAEANAQLLSVPLASVRDDRMMPTPAEPFLSVAKQHPDTSAGEYALLLGAESLFTDGKFPEAHQEFSKFID